MVNRDYIPERGDLVWVDFSPQRGHEQGGKRPAVVISRGIYNERSGLTLICPVTSKNKEYPFEVLLRERKINGFVLSDQIRSIDWKTRRVRFISRIDPGTFKEISEKIASLIIG